MALYGYGKKYFTWIFAYIGLMLFCNIAGYGVCVSYVKGILPKAILWITGAMSFYFHFKVVHSDPGYLPKTQKQPPQTTPGVGPQHKNCYTCNIVRPLRSKHCRVCDRCVQKFDHHCIFVNACIGQKNFAVFFAFILSTAAHIYSGLALGLYYFMYEEPDESVIFWGFTRHVILIVCMTWGVYLTFGITLVTIIALIACVFNVTLNEVLNSKRYGYPIWRPRFYNPFYKDATTNLLMTLNFIKEPVLYDWKFIQDGSRDV